MTLEMGDTFVPTALLQPSTYVNKVLVCSASGIMQLWNVRSGKQIFQFAQLPASVVSVVQSPVLDVIGLGLSNGSVLVHNLKHDKTLMTFRVDGPVLSLAFRSGAPSITCPCLPWAPLTLMPHSFPRFSLSLFLPHLQMTPPSWRSVTTRARSPPLIWRSVVW